MNERNIRIPIIFFVLYPFCHHICVATYHFYVNKYIVCICFKIKKSLETTGMVCLDFFFLIVKSDGIKEVKTEPPWLIKGSWCQGAGDRLPSTYLPQNL